MIYPESFEKKIGFDAVRAEISRLCTSVPGRCAAEKMLRFSNSRRQVIERLETTAEMVSLIGSSEGFSLGSISDVATILGGVRAEGTFLTADQLLQLNSSLSTATALSIFFRIQRNEEGSSPFPRLDVLAQSLSSFPQVISLIERTVDRFGEVRDSASPELAQIRRQLQSTQASLSSVMRRVISRAVEGGYLEADASAVVRDGRLVLPVSPMNKRKINGIVHDESASGKTYFIEPAELVEANNRIRELQIEEKREIVRILRVVTDMVRPDINLILATVDLLGVFDFVHAKALYAIDIDANMPHISKHTEIEWYHAVHPVLLQSLRNQGKDIVPLDIRLTQKERILVISGPNAGGKSVCLKTVGVVQYMTQVGLLPPVYDNSHIGIFDNIFIDIGDDQSIEDDLSTYSSHLRNMKHFLSRGDASTLVLIDEFGGGTEPLIGGAIAQAILKEFNVKQMWGVVTTHYQNLKTFAEDTPGLINGSMLYDRHKMQPLFKLSIGTPGSSFAIEIARKTGLPPQIVADAEEIAGSDYVKLDRYLLDIARDRRYWENKRDSIKQKEKRLESVLAQYEEDAETLRSKRREIIREAQADAQRIIDESNASVERTIREIRNAQADKEKTREARRRLSEQKAQMLKEHADDEHPLLKKSPKTKKKKSSESPKQEAQPTFEIGAHVKLEGQSTVGTILELQGNQAVVSFGMLKTTVKTSRLRHTIAKPSTGQSASSFVSNQTASASRERQLNFSREIDVRGMRVDEALQAITYYIDDAIQFSAGQVRILHGTGTGALRQSIRQYLESISGVESYRDEHVQFGGAGITVVTLR